jgi:hypothetical protein
MHRREVHDKVRMLNETLLDSLAMLGVDLITHAMHHPDGPGNLPGQLFQNSNTCLLPFACSTRRLDCARSGVTGGKRREDTSTLIFGLASVRDVLRLGGPSRRLARTWWQHGLLVRGQHRLIWAQWPCVEVGCAEAVPSKAPSRGCLGYHQQ